MGSASSNKRLWGVNSFKKKHYSDEEKRQILAKLNQKRLSVEKREDVIRQVCHNKKIYKIYGRDYYKIADMGSVHYVFIASCTDITSVPSPLSLYTSSFSKMEEKKGLIKIDSVSNRILVSYDTQRISFKLFALEEI